MTIPLDLNSLYEHLNKKEMKPQLQEETKQILLAFRANEQHFPLFIRVNKQERFVQILTFFQEKIDSKCAAELARFLHLLNNQINLPGLSMDEKENLIFYRAMLPCNSQVIDAVELDQFLGAAFTVCNSFSGLIYEVAQGKISFATAEKKLHKKAEKISKK